MVGETHSSLNERLAVSACWAGFFSRNEILKSQDCDKLQSNAASMSRQSHPVAVSSLGLQYTGVYILMCLPEFLRLASSSHPRCHHTLCASAEAHGAPKAPPAPSTSTAIHFLPPNTALSRDGNIRRGMNAIRILAGITCLLQGSVSLLLS